MSDAKKTPLYEDHVKAGARMVDFAGWSMPVEYAGLRTEHVNVRDHVGLFDVSHMGEIRVKGPKALASIEWLTSNNASRLKKGQAQYSLLMNPQGGIVDDLIVYCLEENNDYLLCVNASNKDKDYRYIVENNRGASIEDESAQWAQIAVQGPKAFKLLDRLFGEVPRRLKSFHFAEEKFAGTTVLIAKTGYTGEAGVEIFVPAKVASQLWQKLLAEGEDLSVMPIGLGARDTLRTEMKYPLYGNDIDDTTDPYSAGLGWVVKPDAKDFIGRSEVVKFRERGLQKKWVGFKITDKGIPRHGYRVFSFDNEEIGTVTSGTLSPSLNENIGLAYVKQEFADKGTEFLIEIRARKLTARVVETPFVTPKGAE